MGQAKKNSVTVATTANYVLTTSFAVVAPATGSALTLTCPRSGYYNIKSSFVFEGLTSGCDCTAYIAINTIKVSRAMSGYDPSTNRLYIPFTICIDNIYLKKGDIVSVYAKYTNAGGNNIQYIADSLEPYLQITEV